MSADFSAVTEVAGNRLRPEAISMMYTRYRFAAGRARGRDILEVGCGAGQGLGILAASGRRVVGGDYTLSLVAAARRHYGTRVPLLCLDGQQLPFRDATFDAVVLYEAIYYLPRAERFIAEANRILRKDGVLLICTVNPEWSEFNSSPHSTRYFSPRDLEDLLRRRGFRSELHAAYAAAAPSSGSRITSWVRRAAIKLHLMPKTMGGKEFLKRLFYGNLTEMPAELTDAAHPAETPQPLSLDAPPGAHKVFYAVGTKAGAASGERERQPRSR